MKKILFFLGTPISHIKPILPLIKNIATDCEVTCLCSKETQYILEKENINTIIYPYESNVNQNNKVYEEIDEKIHNNYHDLKKLMYYKLKKDIFSLYNFNKTDIDKIEHIIDNVNPDVIFRDSVDIIGKIVCRKKKIKTIGYITNNLYSTHFFMKNPKFYISHFLRIAEWDYIYTEDDYNMFFNYVTSIYREISLECDFPQIDTYNQLDPNEESNIIFSINFLQPKELETSRKYILCPPVKEYYHNSHTNIDSEIIDFLNTKQKVIYISTGSFAMKGDEYYKNIIKAFNQTNFKLLISWNKDLEYIQSILPDDLDVKKYLIKNYVPQKFVLKRVDLFISAGGFNSILESIYYKVPMIINPISAEQVLNGILIEELNLGMTTYKKRDNYLSTGEMIELVLHNPEIKRTLAMYSQKLTEQASKGDYSEIRGLI